MILVSCPETKPLGRASGAPKASRGRGITKLAFWDKHKANYCLFAAHTGRGEPSGRASGAPKGKLSEPMDEGSRSPQTSPLMPAKAGIQLFLGSPLNRRAHLPPYRGTR